MQEGDGEGDNENGDFAMAARGRSYSSGTAASGSVQQQDAGSASQQHEKRMYMTVSGAEGEVLLREVQQHMRDQKKLQDLEWEMHRCLSPR